MNVQVGPNRLTIESVVEVARRFAKVDPLSDSVRAQVQKTADWVANTVRAIASDAKPKAYYGINTGFGALAGRSVLNSQYLTEVLGRNLMASHSVGVGPYFDEAVIRAALLIRAQSLAQGLSGVRPLIVETLIAMLNAGVYPAVPEQGSLGASGDLAPLAHLLLTMCEAPVAGSGDEDLHLDTTDGEAFAPCTELDERSTYHLTEEYRSGQQRLWRRIPGREAMAAVGGKITPQAKEALALINGSTFSAALAAFVVADAQNLLDHFELATAMTVEGIRGFRDPFFPQLHRARGHQAAEQIGSRILKYLENSELADAGNFDMDPMRVPPQDPYSVRCTPQVFGTCADTLELARRWVEMDLNAVTDNPLIFLELERDYKTVSGGNFHGEPIAMAMDFLAIALTELGNIADRRLFMLTDYHVSKPYHGLPGFLIDGPKITEGLNSGLMMMQATSASLVSDCKALAHPDSVDSIPSSANQEDHVSMSLNAARHAREIVKNIEQIAAMELLCAAQAIDLQKAKPGNAGLCLGKGTRAACEIIRGSVPMLTKDRVLYPDIRRVVRLVREGSLVRAAKAAAGC